ncbi:MAG: hypothetical protein J5822_08145, partial [Eubacteriaceae bacterium]|nr:hypothetical protein [Eubacteriaceae bacterium]
MADLKRYTLNRPEYGIYMNELALGGTSINTIGFFMRFPTLAPETLRDAADRVIQAVPVFSLTLAGQPGSPCLQETAQREPCQRGEALTAQEAAARWETLAESTLDGKMYAFCVGPLTDGGAYLMARFHHILLDGYDMSKLARRILDELAGTGVEDVGPLTRYAPAEPDEAAERSFWLNYFYDADYEPFLFPVTAESTKRTRFRFPLGAELTARIQAFAAERDVTAASVFAGALSLYLARASQKREA